MLLYPHASFNIRFPAFGALEGNAGTLIIY